MLSLLQSADDVIDLALAGERYLLASKECQEARTHRLVAQNQLLHSISIQGGRMLRARAIATYGSAAVMKGLAPPLSLSLSLSR